MKKYDKNAEKLTDKAFSHFIFMSFLSIFICILCLCGATYAWFTTNTANRNNTVKSGSFELNVTVTDHLGAELNVTGISKDKVWYRINFTYTENGQSVTVENLYVINNSKYISETKPAA